MNQFKAIPGYEGNYTISRHGFIKNKMGKPVHAWKSKLGYMRINLSLRGKKRQYFVHRLVALAYIPNPANYPVVNHIDGDKLNNHTENLEWCTHLYNTHHAQRIGLSKVKKLKHGTVSGYNFHKCRCIECREAWRAYAVPKIRAYRQRATKLG